MTATLATPCSTTAVNAPSAAWATRESPFNRRATRLVAATNNGNKAVTANARSQRMTNAAVMKQTAVVTAAAAWTIPDDTNSSTTSTSAESRAIKSPLWCRPKKSGLSRCRQAKVSSRSRNTKFSAEYRDRYVPVKVAAPPTTASPTHTEAGVQNRDRLARSAASSTIVENIHTANVSAAAARRKNSTLQASNTRFGRTIGP